MFGIWKRPFSWSDMDLNDMTTFWVKQSREIVRRVMLAFLESPPFGSHRRQFMKHCLHHSTCVVMGCGAGEWHEISRSDLPPLLVASLPPPWSHRKQFVTPSCAIDCVVYVLWVAWLEWPQKHDFVASSERGVCSTRSRRMTSPVYQSCLAFTLGSRQYQQGPIRLALSDPFMQVWSLPGEATNHLAYV